MTRQVRQIFGQPDSVVTAYTGPSRELVVNTDTHRVHIQDGATAGGWPLRLISDPDLSSEAVKTSSYTTTDKDKNSLIVENSATPVTVTLHSLASATPMAVIGFRNVGVGAMTITTNSGDAFDVGGTSIVLATGDECRIRAAYDKSAWRTVRWVGALGTLAAASLVLKTLTSPNVAPYPCAGQIAFDGGSTSYGLGFRSAATAGGSALVFTNSAGAVVGSVGQSATSTEYYTTSDIRLKEDFKPINSDAFFEKVQVYDFQWKGTKDRSVGVIAQELAEIYPQAVSRPADESQTLSVDYSKLIPFLLAEVKSLRSKVEELSNLKDGK